MLNLVKFLICVGLSLLYVGLVGLTLILGIVRLRSFPRKAEFLDLIWDWKN